MPDVPQPQPVPPTNFLPMGGRTTSQFWERGGSERLKLRSFKFAYG